MLCTEIVSDIQNNFCTQQVLPIFCKKKASDKDLSVSLQFGNQKFKKYLKKKSDEEPKY